ncbi:hypothetical protein N7462_009018 [Penicillium macrosclerotiorum]|uniref:uncharacterized protein n=1 Tax=Penicillium macrosclerotiorum TaxID=303699 RepID=UPI0025469F85|nr:uncharacterized protein N7462_009018 [Penicillium macrosclerotiorum]KAJ5676121.1 hypothetical protein N7462_009018 [Penicillium macrosclerotiorum]
MIAGPRVTDVWRTRDALQTYIGEWHGFAQGSKCVQVVTPIFRKYCIRKLHYTATTGRKRNKEKWRQMYKALNRTEMTMRQMRVQEQLSLPVNHNAQLKDGEGKVIRKDIMGKEGYVGMICAKEGRGSWVMRVG